MSIPLPRVNPNSVSGLSIVTSMLFLLSYPFSAEIAIAWLIVTLLLDWFDGAIAKKHGMVSEEGYIVDVASDRFSEGLIFSMVFFPWFYLFVLNSVLSVLSVKTGRHIIIPLRHIFLLYLIFLYAMPFL